jgi:molybdopterin-guanine dinucleotide biosynthesis protein B
MFSLSVFSMIIISLIGLKKSGKTTTAEALIREFKSRGYKVGGVKFMNLSKFTVDTEGKDTWRHKEAGADFVVSLSEDEMAFIERREEHASLDNALEHIPKDTDILVCEGLTEDRPGIIRIVIAKDSGLLNDTFEVRGIKEGVIALSGILANKISQHPNYPVFNCNLPEETSQLADLILRESEKRSG